MRLQITKRPERRHLGITSQTCVLGHHNRGLSRSNNEEVYRQRARSFRRIKSSCWARKIESAEWLMEEHGPATRADEPGNRRAPTVRAQAITSLTVSHFVLVAAPIELWSPF